jgi:hypothetical protein
LIEGYLERSSWVTSEQQAGCHGSLLVNGKSGSEASETVVLQRGKNCLHMGKLPPPSDDLICDLPVMGHIWVVPDAHEATHHTEHAHRIFDETFVRDQQMGSIADPIETGLEVTVPAANRGFQDRTPVPPDTAPSQKLGYPTAWVFACHVDQRRDDVPSVPEEVHKGHPWDPTGDLALVVEMHGALFQPD